jgi:hypothetical protein
LPFRLTASREGQAETGIFEFPVTVEDEASPSLLQRLPQSLALSERLASYGGLLVALIHTDVVEAKLEYEQRLVEALRARAWFGTVREFGEFWSARDQVRVDVRADGARLQVVVHAPASIAGLTLALPVGYRAVSIDHGVTFTQSGGRLILGSLSGTATVVLEPADSDRPY